MSSLTCSKVTYWTCSWHLPSTFLFLIRQLNCNLNIHSKYTRERNTTSRTVEPWRIMARSWGRNACCCAGIWDTSSLIHTPSTFHRTSARRPSSVSAENTHWNVSLPGPLNVACTSTLSTVRVERLLVDPVDWDRSRVSVTFQHRGAKISDQSVEQLSRRNKDPPPPL